MVGKKLLWLDDLRNPFTQEWLSLYAPNFVDNKEEVVWVKNYDEFVEWIESNGLPYQICFDNDLGEEMEGKDCAKYLVEYCLDNDVELPLYSIQSANTVAKKFIKNLLLNFLNR